MASKTEICNLALSHLGNGEAISNIDTERSKAAATCKLFYETVRRTVLRSFVWPFSVKRVSLGLIEETPNTEWAYAYQYPSDCLLALKVPSGYRDETVAQRVPFKIVHSSTGKIIYTDVENAELEYVFDNDDEDQFDDDFVLAFSYLLAAYIAPRVTGHDYFDIQKNMFSLYSSHIQIARANAAVEEEPGMGNESSFVDARN